MTPGPPEYIAERSVWWEEGTKTVIRRLNLSGKSVYGIRFGLEILRLMF